MSDGIDVAVAGGALATYAIQGDGPGPASRDAEPVLAIHGITSSSRTWLAVGRELGTRGRLIAVDLRGRAASNELPGPFGIDAHVDDMLAVLDRFDLERAVVVGHSLGAYIAARLAVRHPERIRSLVLVDGGLTIPLEPGADPQAFLESFLAATLARLTMTFPDVWAYRDWWLAHPAIAAGDVAAGDLLEYAEHDLVGEPPALRPSVNPDAIREDGADLFRITDARAIDCPATLLCAERGMVDDPNPMQPQALVESWAAQDPERRHALPVAGVNHYTIALGATGARVVAEAIARAVQRTPSSTSTTI